MKAYIYPLNLSIDYLIQFNTLVLIEVQTGDYLGEDDIVRFDDYMEE